MAKKKASNKASTKKKASKKVAKKASTKKKAAKKTATKKKAAKKTATKKAATAKKAPKATKATAKRKAALAVVMGSSARMALEAKRAVYAISSEKTIGQFEAGIKLADDAEGTRMLALAEGARVLTSETRRSTRDQFGAFRAELTLSEDVEGDPHAGWRIANGRFRHELLPGLTVEELAALERTLKVKLPPSYYDFCLQWNGGELFIRRGGGYRVVGASQLRAELKRGLCDRMYLPYLPVVSLGCGDYLALDTSKENRSGENPLYWWYCDKPVSKVADSFGLWVKKLVETKGRAFWWDL